MPCAVKSTTQRTPCSHAVNRDLWITGRRRRLPAPMSINAGLLLVFSFFLLHNTTLKQVRPVQHSRAQYNTTQNRTLDIRYSDPLTQRSTTGVFLPHWPRPQAASSLTMVANATPVALGRHVYPSKLAMQESKLSEPCLTKEGRLRERLHPCTFMADARKARHSVLPGLRSRSSNSIE